MAKRTHTSHGHIGIQHLTLCGRTVMPDRIQKENRVPTCKMCFKALAAIAEREMKEWEPSEGT